MKMKVKYAILLGLIVLLTTILSSCKNPPHEVPPSVEGAEKLTAKEAWAIIDSAKETLGIDGDLVYINASNSRYLPITEGAASIWIAGLYSESEKTVQAVQYFHWQKGTDKSKPQLWGKPRSEVSLTVYDLADWNVDSPEACDIAAQNGAGVMVWLRLQGAYMEAIDNAPIYKTPEFIPESTKLFWVIYDGHGDMYYIDANTGEYLGSEEF